MLDTNIIISAGIFRGGVAMAVEYISHNHELVISSFAIDELWRVTARKFPSRKPVVEKFLRNLAFELAYTPSVIHTEEYPQIRDVKDYPILASAISSDVDILITGDRDFEEVTVERPEIMTIGGFMEKYA
jgi:putative PIN family toxin of toxin-antitoxin system